jgi:hypothetical protein
MHPFSTDPGWYERHWYGLRPGRSLRPDVGKKPGSGKRPLPSRSTVTLGLAAYFIAASLLAALLATHFGWIDASLAP